MAAADFRFRPPPYPLDDPALRWVLVRAFADPAAEVPGAPGPRVVDHAIRLSLAARVAARIGRERLWVEIGPEAAAELQVASRAAVARALQLEGLRRRLAIVAKERGIPWVLLKFAALEAAGVLQPGSRSVSDLDVLVSRSAAEPLIAALRQAGFEPGDEPEQEHQWPALFSQGVALELHRHLPGVTVPGGSAGFATAEALAEAGALVPVADGVFRPKDVVLAAHLCAHSLAQHGLTPEGYPAFRAFADLSDLGLGKAPDTTWQEVHRWLPAALSGRELAAARSLLQALEAGRLEVEGDAATLRAHLLAGAFDSHYRSALKLRLFAPPLSERSRGRAWVAFLRRTVWLTDSQIEDIYGRPQRRLGYFARRVWRPFDLVVRSWRAVRAARGGRPGT